MPPLASSTLPCTSIPASFSLILLLFIGPAKKRSGLSPRGRVVTSAAGFYTRRPRFALTGELPGPGPDPAASRSGRGTPSRGSEQAAKNSAAHRPRRGTFAEPAAVLAPTACASAGDDQLSRSRFRAHAFALTRRDRM